MAIYLSRFRVSRPFLAVAVTVRIRLQKGERVRCYYESDLWIHQYGGDYVVDRKPSLITASERKRLVRDVYLNCYEPRAGDIILDVGAGVGSEAVEFARLVGETGWVVACEANPATARCAEVLFALTGTKNVTLVVAAAADSPGTVRISDNPRHRENRVGAEVKGGAAYHVPAVALDSLGARFPGKVDFIKMNIEGAELAALRGMSETLAHATAVAVFCHDFVARYRRDPPPPTRDAVEALLRNAGYVTYRREDDPRPGVRDCVYGIRSGGRPSS